MRHQQIQARFSHVLTILPVVFLSTIAFGQAPGISSGALTPEQKLDLAIRKLDSQDLREAERLINDVMLEKPTLMRLKLARGLFFKATPGRASEAIDELDQYNSSPEARSEWRGFAAIGDIYIKSRMYSSALGPLQRAAELAPLKEDGRNIRAEVLLNLAMANVGMQNFKAAVKIAKDAQAAAPTDGDVQLRLAEIAATANDYESSVAAVDQAVLLYKSDIRDDAFNRAAHEKLRQCYNVAASLYDYQRRLDPENAEPYYRSGKLMLQIADVNRRMSALEALRLVGQAVERSPKNIEMRITIIELEYSLGGIKDSEAMIEKILELDENNAAALEWRDKLRTAPPRPVLM